MMTCLTVHGYVLCFVVATVYYVVSSCCLQSRFRTLVFSYACGVLHVAVGCFSPMYATAGVVCLDQCDRCNQSIKITQSRSLLHIVDMADYRVDCYAFVAYMWRCIVVVYILLSLCDACMCESGGHFLVSFQLYPVERPNTAIHRRIPVDTDVSDTGVVHEA